MEIEIRLKKLLIESDLDDHGVQGHISEDLGIDRHTVGKLYHNEAVEPSLANLGAICGWLQRHGCQAPLPQSLLGRRPSQLWQAVMAPPSVRIYMAEYRQARRHAPMMRWISRWDAAFQADLVRRLSTPDDPEDVKAALAAEELKVSKRVLAARGGGKSGKSDGGDAPARPAKTRADGPHRDPHVPPQNRPSVLTYYVPHSFVATREPSTPEMIQTDKERSAKAFESMRAEPAGSSSVLVGSQRVNHVLEYWVADLMKRAKPFQPPSDGPVVPFYLMYRQADFAMPSCFGGREPPPNLRRQAAPGIWYLSKRGGSSWAHCPWDATRHDSGVVMTAYDPRIQQMELAIFGYSGRGTEALGKYMIDHGSQFWGRAVQSGRREIGVYICRFEAAPNKRADDEGSVHAVKIKVIPLGEKVLKDFLP
jgi:hypothetical protein